MATCIRKLISLPRLQTVEKGLCLRASVRGFKSNILPRDDDTGQVLSRTTCVGHARLHTQHPQIHCRAPYSTGVLTEGPGILSRLWQGLGLPSKLKYKKMELKNAGLRLYLCCVEIVDYDHFCTEFNLPDTFNTWFRITELHIWMCMVRLVREAKEGVFVRNKLLQFMWLDVDKRTRKLGDGTSSTSRRDGVLNIGAHFKATLFAYDEGLLSDDTVLAGALWRNFFEMDCADVEHIEKLVQYVRKQMHYLEMQDSAVVIQDGLVKFLPLHGDEEDVTRTKPILTEIYRRV